MYRHCVGVAISAQFVHFYRDTYQIFRMDPIAPHVHVDIAVAKLLHRQLGVVDRTGDLLVVSNWIKPCDADAFQTNGKELCVVPEISLCECSAMLGHMVKVMQLKFDSILWLSLSRATNREIYEVHGATFAMLVLVAVVRGVFVVVDAEAKLPSALKCVVDRINCKTCSVSVAKSGHTKLLTLYTTSATILSRVKSRKRARAIDDASFLHRSIDNLAAYGGQLSACDS